MAADEEDVVGDDDVRHEEIIESFGKGYCHASASELQASPRDVNDCCD